jgi:L-aminopeptidase/D-esterase-like protein
MKSTVARAVAGLGVVAIAGTVVSLAQRAPASSTMTNKTLTAVAGIRVGHVTLCERPTGCTVVVVDGDGAIGGYAQRGGAPGTRDADLLNPLNTVEQVNAIFLTGGSAYGISVGDGVTRYLEEKKVGFKIAGTVVPIVPGAVLMDLGFGGSSTIRPNADCGYRAASTASDGPVAEGNVGAGAGSTVGKLLGSRDRAMKAGVGSSSIA